MRKLTLCAAALLFGTSLAMAQGSGAAGDIGSGSIPGAKNSQTVGQSAADPTTPAPAPKAAKKTATKQKK